MLTDVNAVQVSLASDRFHPRSFTWHGQIWRVLSVDGVCTRGIERRFRVMTRSGVFELALHTGDGQWRVLRKPGWMDRMWARVRRLPRYPLPPWRRRTFEASLAWSPAPCRALKEENDANRLALVRQ